MLNGSNEGFSHAFISSEPTLRHQKQQKNIHDHIHNYTEKG